MHEGDTLTYLGFQSRRVDRFDTGLTAIAVANAFITHRHLLAFRPLLTQCAGDGLMAVDLVVAVAAVVLGLHVLGGHWEEGREDEKDRRHSNGQG